MGLSCLTIIVHYYYHYYYYYNSCFCTKQNMVWTHWRHFPDCKAIHLFPSNGTSSARFKWLTGAYIFMPGDWAWLALIFYPIVFDSCATLWKQKNHLVMYDISNKLTCLLQTQQYTHCICMLQLQPEKRENRIPLMWFALLPLNSFTLELYHQTFLKEESIFHSHQPHGIPSQIQFRYNSTLQILSKRSMKTISLLFRITFNHCSQAFSRVISPHNNFPFKQ